MGYIRVILKKGKSFWAKSNVARTKIGNLYEPVNKEGDDYSSLKDGKYIIRKHFISGDLIKEEKPATMNLKYGELELKGRRK